jgi:hypothetical protein
MRKKMLLGLLLAVLAPAAVVVANTTTPILGLNQPAPGVDTNWGPLLNANMTVLDNAVLANGTGINGRVAVFSNNHVVGPSTMAVGALATLTGTQTLTGKTIDSATNTLKIAGVTITALSGNTGKIMSGGAGTFPNGNLAKFDASGNVVDAGIPAAGGGAPFADTVALVKNNSDATKTATFDLSLLGTGTFRRYKLPNVDADTVALLAATQIFTGKTYDTAGVGNVFKINGVTLTGVKGNSAIVQLQTGSYTTNELVKADANGNTVGSGVLATDVVTLTGAQTLTNKTLTAPTINSAVLGTKVNYAYGTAFPGTPGIGDTIVIVDDSAAGECDSSAGSGVTLCRYNGATWEALGGGGGGGGITIPSTSTGTIPNTANTSGLFLDVSTTAGNANGTKALRVSLGQTNTGNVSYGGSFFNENPNVGVALNLAGGGGYPTGAVGVQGAAFPDAAGHAIGVDGDASGSNSYNIGVYGNSFGGQQPAATTGTAIGVLGTAGNSDESTDLKNVGVYGTLSAAMVTGQNISAAGIFDNGTGSNPIVVFYDNGTEKARFDDGGALGFAGGTNPGCSATEYKIWANTADTKLKKCENGSITDLAGAGGSGDITDVWTVASGNVNALTAASGDTLDAASADSTRPNKSGTSPPGTCAVGDTFFDTDATVGNNIYGCTSTNTWTLEGDAGGAGSGDITDVWSSTSGNVNALTAASGDSLDAGSADSTTPWKIGTAPPGTCTTGAAFFDTDATAGSNVYGCTATNTWTLEGGGGGGGITGTLTSGRIPVASGASTVVDTANFTFDTTNFRQRIQNATTANDNATNMWQLTGTLPTSPSSTVVGVSATVSSAGTAAQDQVAALFVLGAGYAGTNRTFGAVVSNGAAGLGANLNLSSGSDVLANYGFYAAATGSGSGINIAGVGIPSSSTGANIGFFGKSPNTVAGTNIGILGNASGSTEGTDLMNVAVYGTLNNAMLAVNGSYAGLFDGGTLPNANSNALRAKATLPSSPSSGAYGIFFDITSAGSASQSQNGGWVALNSGYSGSSNTIGWSMTTNAAGTGANLRTGVNLGVEGNFGSVNNALAAGPGYNIGALAQAQASTGVNVGSYGRISAAATGTAIGVLGTAVGSTNSNLRNVAGYFTLSTSLVSSTALDAAIIGDNGAVASSIMRLYDNGSLVFDVQDGGPLAVTSTVTSSRTSDIGWSVQTAANQACNTTCTSACVVGIDTTATANGFLSCSDVTADQCLCAGAS